MELTALSAANFGRDVVQQWEQIRPTLCAKLGASRRQFHHAAQFAAAAGISYLESQPDDSHTNLEWLSEFRGLFSREVSAPQAFRIGVRPADLTLLMLPPSPARIAALNLNGCTIADAAAWIRDRIDAMGADSSLYTLQRHYEIPAHPVTDGSVFDSGDRTSFEELSKWFANGFTVLNDLARRTPMSSEVRCWPHHFDVGVLIGGGGGRSIGVGLEPGDDYYNEPYFYVNMSPQPPADRVSSQPIAGGGSWHTREWIGAVLPGSRLRAGASQSVQVREFLDSAVTVAREIVGSD